MNAGDPLLGRAIIGGIMPIDGLPPVIALSRGLHRSADLIALSLFLGSIPTVCIGCVVRAVLGKSRQRVNYEAMRDEVMRYHTGLNMLCAVSECSLP
jgi:hypothetical protein